MVGNDSLQKNYTMSQTVCLNITLLFSFLLILSITLSFGSHSTSNIWFKTEIYTKQIIFRSKRVCTNEGKYRQMEDVLCVHGYTCLCIINTCRAYEDWHQLDAIFFSNMNIFTDKSLSSSAQQAAPHGFIADRECVIRCSWASIKVLSEMIGNRRVGVMIWSVHLGCEMWR